MRPKPSCSSTFIRAFPIGCQLNAPGDQRSINHIHCAKKLGFLQMIVVFQRTYNKTYNAPASPNVAYGEPNSDRVSLLPDLCTEFGLVGDCLLNFGPPRFFQIGFGTSAEDLPL